MNATHSPMVAPARVALVVTLLSLAASAHAADPIALHPDNPRYFLFRGKPEFLITSGEHYGALLNRDFAHGPYLDELRARQFNLTRLFSGSYREVPGAFQIRANNLAPRSASHVAPWPRTKEPGAVDGGNKFDLATWEPTYFDRLNAVVSGAAVRGIVVEFVLFCPFYEENLWDVNPMNARNNVNHVGTMPRTDVYTLKYPAMLAIHEALVRKLVTELHRFDNLYYEICNEPYFGGVTLDWQERIAAVIVETEWKLGGPRHLIAQNIANGRAKIDQPNPAVSVFNFHYATPPDVIALNPSLKKAIGDDETGFLGTGDRIYRSEAWEFLLAGGSTFSNLDYSFTVQHPDGSAAVEPPTPGGGGPSLRKQLAILRSFLAGFDFVQMVPERTVIRRGVPDKARAQVLSARGHAYAIYLNSGTRVDLVLELPAGNYRALWIDPRTGALDGSEELAHKGGECTLRSPHYDEDIALKVVARL
jgi:hypothetical protein